MAPAPWGLDLGEIKWSKFKSSYMWNNEYHLRRTKFVVYQLAMILCVVSESLGTAALSDYNDEQKKIEQITNNTASEDNDDYVGAAAYNIFAGVYVAFIFGGAFFFDLIWPERHESKGVRLAWKICGPLAIVFHLAAALWLTVVTARHSSVLSGVPREDWAELVDQYKKASQAPLTYRHNGRAVASICFAWPGFVAVVASNIILFMSINHDEKLGPKSTHARLRDEKAAAGQEDVERGNLSGHEKPIDEPAPVHQYDGAAELDASPDVSAKQQSSPSTR